MKYLSESTLKVHNTAQSFDFEMLIKVMYSLPCIIPLPTISLMSVSCMCCPSSVMLNELSNNCKIWVINISACVRHTTLKWPQYNNNKNSEGKQTRNLKQLKIVHFTSIHQYNFTTQFYSTHDHLITGGEHYYICIFTK